VDAEGQVTMFVQRRGEALMGLARLLVAHPQDAEDLVQEALARCLPHWGKVRDDPEGYVRRTMVRIAIDRGRRRRRRPEVLGEPPEQVVPDASDGVEARIALIDALRRLPARQRVAVVLRFYLDLDERSTAAIMGCAVGTVKSLSSRGLSTLRGAASTPPGGDR